uniref:Uncharacterized protein n=1 Tax=Lygus hesperus TaxID=30085 RepID=A0A0A9Y7Y8_LYGHE
MSNEYTRTMNLIAAFLVLFACHQAQGMTEEECADVYKTIMNKVVELGNNEIAVAKRIYNVKVDLEHLRGATFSMARRAKRHAKKLVRYQNLLLKGAKKRCGNGGGDYPGGGYPGEDGSGGDGSGGDDTPPNVGPPPNNFVPTEDQMYYCPDKNCVSHVCSFGIIGTPVFQQKSQEKSQKGWDLNKWIDMYVDPDDHDS